jgi:hypothetical protein
MKLKVMFGRIVCIEFNFQYFYYLDVSYVANLRKAIKILALILVIKETLEN